MFVAGVVALVAAWLSLTVARSGAGEPPPVQPTHHDAAELAAARAQAGVQQANAVPAPRMAAAAAAAGGGSFVTYRVFATQYAPTTAGSVEVAVPDKCVKFAARNDTTSLNNYHCGSGYPTGGNYRVVVARDTGQQATIPVNEVGPWNVDDNYWDPSVGPRPRRMFSDLAQGTPESQAAYYNNYNYSSNCSDLSNPPKPTGHGGGADQFGRCVLNPSALDLSFAAASLLGLGSGQNDWVTVSYLWEPSTGPAWQPWNTIGAPPGGLTSGPDVAAWSPGRFDVFGRGGDGALWHAWFDGTWRGWESLGGALVGAPSVTSWGPGRLDVMVRGTDNQLYHRWFDGAWRGWEPLGKPPGGLTAGPEVTTWGNGRLDVFGRGGDKGLWHAWFDGAWHGWESLGGGLAGDPGAAAWANGRLDVVVRGTDNNLWHKWFDGAWRGWESLGAPAGGLTSNPDVAAWSAGRLDVFARGGDKALWHKWFDGAWHGWESLGGALTGDPGATAPAASRLAVFVPGTDNEAWYRLFA